MGLLFPVDLWFCDIPERFDCLGVWGVLCHVSCLCNVTHTVIELLTGVALSCASLSVLFMWHHFTVWAVEQLLMNIFK